MFLVIWKRLNSLHKNANQKRLPKVPSIVQVDVRTHLDTKSTDLPPLQLLRQDA